MGKWDREQEWIGIKARKCMLKWIERNAPRGDVNEFANELLFYGISVWQRKYGIGNLEDWKTDDKWIVRKP